MNNSNHFKTFAAVASVALSAAACAGTSPRVETAEHRTSHSDAAASRQSAGVDGTVGNEHWKKMR